ncbi:MAG: hypothetical protein ACHQ7M_11275, partial [Chloroflexota bacterium]
VKFDATDHADDPFFPGPADIAWDLAAIGVEFGQQRGAAVVAEYRRSSGDRGSALRARLAWHGLAYAAFRCGYCRLAAEQAGAAEAEGFRRQGARYRTIAGRLWRAGCPRR